MYEVDQALMGLPVGGAAGGVGGVVFPGVFEAEAGTSGTGLCGGVSSSAGTGGSVSTLQG